MFGYESWWVTNDRSAFRMAGIAAEDGLELPSSPCMSPNFLTNLLALGPTREKLGTGRLALPVALDIQRGGWGIPGLSRLADEIRGRHAGEPEWLLRRRVRDAMNAVKEERQEVAAGEREQAGEPTGRPNKKSVRTTP